MITASKTIFKRYIIIDDNNENYYLVDKYEKPLVSVFAFSRWLNELKAYSITAEQCQMIEKYKKPQKQVAIPFMLCCGIGIVLKHLIDPFIDSIHYDASKMFYAIMAMTLTMIYIIAIIYLYKRDEKNLTRIIELSEPKYIKLSYDETLDFPVKQEFEKYSQSIRFTMISIEFLTILNLYATIESREIVMMFIYFIFLSFILIGSLNCFPPQPITKINIIDKGDK